MHGGPLHAFALAVDDPQVQHALLAAGLEVRFHGAGHLARRERVQVEDTVERKVHGLFG